MTGNPAGWYTDPTNRHVYRYWDGAEWSDQVSDGGTSGSDPEGLDPALRATPPAPGTAAPAAPPPAPSPTVQVTQGGGGGFGMGAILGVLIGIVIIVLIVLVLLSSGGDDGGTTTTVADVTTTAGS